MCAAVQQCEDEHPYALHTYLLEELNKMGIAYVRLCPACAAPTLIYLIVCAHASYMSLACRCTSLSRARCIPWALRRPMPSSTSSGAIKLWTCAAAYLPNHWLFCLSMSA